MPSSTFDPLDTTMGGSGAPSWMGSQNDLFKELQDQYGKVDTAFDTHDFDQAAEKQYSNIETQGETSANAAAAEYSNRARQSGGSGEGAGLVKAEAMVGARSQVADFRMKQMQYDIAQREGAAQMASEIGSHLDSLRMDYLKNLTGWNEELARNKNQMDIAALEAKNRIDVANIGANVDYAKLGEQKSEFDLLHNPRPWNGSTDLFGNFTGTDQYGRPLNVSNYSNPFGWGG